MWLKRLHSRTSNFASRFKAKASMGIGEANVTPKGGKAIYEHGCRNG